MLQHFIGKCPRHPECCDLTSRLSFVILLSRVMIVSSLSAEGEDLYDDLYEDESLFYKAPFQEVRAFIFLKLQNINLTGSLSISTLVYL